jgi:mannose-6-phosphate isomerase
VETTTPALRERLFDCDHFTVWRVKGDAPFTVGAEAVPRVLVGLAGKGRLEHDGGAYEVGGGDVFLLPAAVGECTFRPIGGVVVLEAALPE